MRCATSDVISITAPLLSPQNVGSSCGRKWITAWRWPTDCRGPRPLRAEPLQRDATQQPSGGPRWCAMDFASSSSGPKTAGEGGGGIRPRIASQGAAGEAGLPPEPQHRGVGVDDGVLDQVRSALPESFTITWMGVRPMTANQQHRDASSDWLLQQLEVSPLHQPGCTPKWGQDWSRLFVAVLWPLPAPARRHWSP
jgi:hypothetical protein